MAGAIAGLAVMVALAGAEEWKSVGVTSPDPSVSLTEVHRVRARLIDERLSLAPPTALLGLSFVSGAGAALLFYGAAQFVVTHWSTVFVLVALVIAATVFTVAHVALGVLSSFLFAKAFPNNASIDARVKQIDQVLAFEVPPPAPVRPEAMRPAHEAAGAR